MDKFLSLPPEKRSRIIEAGLCCFGKMGYKKASVQDIAQLAGISKGMIFHYFGSKKGMYCYLIQISVSEILGAFQTEFDPSVSDFFRRILMLARCKVNCMKTHPSLLAFFASLCAETDPEVSEERQAVLAQSRRAALSSLLSGSDVEKFKQPEYARLTWDLLMGYSSSVANSAASMDMAEIDEMQRKFEACIQMLRQNLYKPEYL